MKHSLTVRCSNCGNLAQRTYTQSANGTVKTECYHCDYYMVVCIASGQTIEAHTSCTAIALQPKAILVPIIQESKSSLPPLPLFDLSP